MATAECLKNRSHHLLISLFRLGGGLDEFICYATHGGNDDDDIAVLRGGFNDVGDFFDTACVVDRRPAKLHNPQRLLGVPENFVGYDAKRTNLCGTRVRSYRREAN